VKGFTKFELIHKLSWRLVKRPPLTLVREREKMFFPKLRKDKGKALKSLGRFQCLIL
jgi:hypothetical protein